MIRNLVLVLGNHTLVLKIVNRIIGNIHCHTLTRNEKQQQIT